MLSALVRAVAMLPLPVLHGIGALLGSIDQTAIQMAEEALAKLPK